LSTILKIPKTLREWRLVRDGNPEGKEEFMTPMDPVARQRRALNPRILAHWPRILAMEIPDHYAVGLHNADITPNHTLRMFHAACVAERTPSQENVISQLLGAGVDIDTVSDIHGYSALITAVYNARSDIMEILLRLGADVNNRSVVDGITALHGACASHLVDVVGILLRAGADANAADDEGETVLYLACRVRDEDIVRMLVAAGADVNVADKDGETPLHEACITGVYGIVTTLLHASAIDVNKVNAQGETALLVAAGSPRGYVPEIVEALIRAGADVNKADNTGKSPLAVALLLNRTDIADVLIRAGAGTAGSSHKPS
jgi:ankyrin repeat protein